VGGAAARGCVRRCRGSVGRSAGHGGTRQPAADICGWWKRDGLTVDRRPGTLV
jgi:hypothetical protein